MLSKFRTINNALIRLKAQNVSINAQHFQQRPMQPQPVPQPVQPIVPAPVPSVQPQPVQQPNIQQPSDINALQHASREIADKKDKKI